MTIGDHFLYGSRRAALTRGKVADCCTFWDFHSQDLNGCNRETEDLI